MRTKLFRLLSIIVFFFVSFISSGQINDAEIHLLKKLDSIAHSSDVASHFARLYLEVKKESIIFYQHYDSSKKSFIKRFEHSFARLFFDAAEAYHKGDTTSPVWKTYFEKSGLKPLQYELLGINAHINGDLWQALVKEFSWQEIRPYRKIFMRFQKGLALIYGGFYNKAILESPRIKMLHHLSLGLDYFYGRFMLKHWRKRQIRLVEWYFNKPEKFGVKMIKLNKKRNNIDQLILRHL